MYIEDVRWNFHKRIQEPSIDVVGILPLIGYRSSKEVILLIQTALLVIDVSKKFKGTIVERDDNVPAYFHNKAITISFSITFPSLQLLKQFLSHVQK